MNPTHKESLLQETAQLLIYVRKNTNSGVKIDLNLYNAAKDPYCRRDYVPALCAAITDLTEDQLNSIMYDGRNPMARKLADWWEQHQEADRQRILAEQLVMKEHVARLIEEIEGLAEDQLNEVVKSFYDLK